MPRLPTSTLENWSTHRLKECNSSLVWLGQFTSARIWALGDLSSSLLHSPQEKYNSSFCLIYLLSSNMIGFSLQQSRLYTVGSLLERLGNVHTWQFLKTLFLCPSLKNKIVKALVMSEPLNHSHHFAYCMLFVKRHYNLRRFGQKCVKCRFLVHFPEKKNEMWPSNQSQVASHIVNKVDLMLKSYVKVIFNIDLTLYQFFLQSVMLYL